MWDQAALRDKDLGEWWCMPSNTKDIGSLQELLRSMEEMLQEWSSTWLQSNGMRNTSTSADEPHIASSVTPFMGLLTRFNMISFAAPIISHQLRKKAGKPSLSPTILSSPELAPFLDCVLKSADAASSCCDSILGMKPVAREFLRYTPDYGFTMMALCCMHLVYAYNMSPNNSTLRTKLAKAEQVAHLMIELSGPNNALPHLYGECILSHLRNSSASIDASGDQTFATGPQQGTMRFEEDLRAMQDMPIPLDLNDHWPAELSTNDFIDSFNGQLPDLFNMYSSLLNSNANEP
jgi:hypothetical protein